MLNEAIKKYNNNELSKIGEGSSRIVFNIDGKKVLKVAISNVGVLQNTAEVELWNKTKNKDFLAEIYNHSHSYKFIEMEKLKQPIMVFYENIVKFHDFCSCNNLSIGDLIKENIGMRDKEFVLIDYGGTEEILNEFYR